MISTNFLTKEQSAKAKLRDGSRNSNRAKQTSQMKKEEVDHQISTIRHFWQLWKRTKAWQPECWPKTWIWIIRPPFVVSKSSEKYRNWLNGSSRTLGLQQSRMCPNFHRFAAAIQAKSVPKKSRHWDWFVASLQKRQKKEGLRFAKC